MKMRAPALPLFTVDPYLSVWSHGTLNDRRTYHWTGSPNTILGTVNVDGTEYCFLGKHSGAVLDQIHVDLDAMSTTVTYENAAIRLTAVFTSPLLVTDLYYTSRPVSYLKLSWEALDGNEHTVTAKLSCSEELVLDKKGQNAVATEEVNIPNAVAVRMGNVEQKVLNRTGDDLRIDWGYLYLATETGTVGTEKLEDMTAIYVQSELKNSALFAIAYDDIFSIEYFHEHLNAYWNRDGKTIEQAITEALADYEEVTAKCTAFSRELWDKAFAAGGEAYAELLSLAYRQVMAAHKLVVDKEGNNLYISKECFSNGCAATVDVTYPSAPIFLHYNPELLKGMLRPILRYCASDAWQFDFAAHDVGQYPILNGQVYCENKLEGQMPIEECGNMITLMAAICDADGNADFAKPHMPMLEQWAKYLIEFGEDPGHQLCTDDFAGHLAHNVNLSIKAIMGIAGYSRILKRLGKSEEADELMQTAKRYAASVCARSVNPDGSYRLAFDMPHTFSLKYNAVWDKLWNTNLFPAEFYEGELKRYRDEAVAYGIPLDSRECYTKSDWIHWISCMGSKEDFVTFNQLLWNAYDHTDRGIPMTDWYYANTSLYRGFKHRTVQGGLWMKFLFL